MRRKDREKLSAKLSDLIKVRIRELEEELKDPKSEPRRAQIVRAINNNKKLIGLN